MLGMATACLEPTVISSVIDYSDSDHTVLILRVFEILHDWEAAEETLDSKGWNGVADLIRYPAYY